MSMLVLCGCLITTAIIFGIAGISGGKTRAMRHWARALDFLRYFAIREAEIYGNNPPADLDVGDLRYETLAEGNEVDSALVISFTGKTRGFVYRINLRSGTLILFYEENVNPNTWVHKEAAFSLRRSLTSEDRDRISGILTGKKAGTINARQR